MAEISRFHGGVESERDWVGWFAFAYRHIRLVFAVGTLFVLGAIAYALLIPFTFTSSALLAPAKKINQASLGGDSDLGQMSPLAALAGLSGGLSGQDTPRLASILSSRFFAEDILLRHGGMQMLYPDDWDAASGRWRDGQPNLDNAVKLFGERFTATIDRATNFIKIKLDAPSATQAKGMLDTIIEELNRLERHRALTQATGNMNYIRNQLEKEHNTDLKNALSAVAQGQLAQIMFATVQKDYAVEVIDPPYQPVMRSAPRRTLIAIIGVLLGGIAALIALIIVRLWPSVRDYFTEVRALARRQKSDV
jgi:LPS O-antigen subunit length determinant protein (WzzB/FepE family)